MTLSCFPNNSIFSVIILRYFFIILSFPFYYGITFVPLLLSHLIASGASSGSSPPSLPHAPYAENNAVVMAGANWNRIRGGSQKKEIGGGGNELPQS